MWQNFFQHIDIEPANVHILNGNAQDLQKECDDYEQAIRDAGGVDLFIGGGVRTIFSAPPPPPPPSPTHTHTHTAKSYLLRILYTRGITCQLISETFCLSVV